MNYCSSCIFLTNDGFNVKNGGRFIAMFLNHSVNMS